MIHFLIFKTFKYFQYFNDVHLKKKAMGCVREII